MEAPDDDRLQSERSVLRVEGDEKSKMMRTMLRAEDRTDVRAHTSVQVGTGSSLMEESVEGDTSIDIDIDIDGASFVRVPLGADGLG